jgi:hypothetical protein
VKRDNANKTHCKRGHEFTPENTKLDRHGWRSCRICDRIRATTVRPRREDPDAREERAWIEAIAQGIETAKDETGEPFIVSFPWPLGEAQERLVRSLGVTPVYEAVPASELAEIAREAAA